MKIFESNSLKLSKDSMQVIEDMEKYMYGLTFEDLQTLCGEHFKIVTYTNRFDLIDDLEFNARTESSIKNLRIWNFEELLDKVHCEEDFLHFNKMGKKSAKEAMLTIFFETYRSLKEKSKPYYIRRVLEANGIYRVGGW